jgi:hypothetical protein
MFPFNAALARLWHVAGRHHQGPNQLLRGPNQHYYNMAMYGWYVIFYNNGQMAHGCCPVSSVSSYSVSSHTIRFKKRSSRPNQLVCQVNFKIQKYLKSEGFEWVSQTDFFYVTGRFCLLSTVGVT